VISASRLTLSVVSVEFADSAPLASNDAKGLGDECPVIRNA